MTYVKVDLPDELLAFVERSARENGVSIEAFVLRCVERVLAEQSRLANPPITPE